MRPSVMVMGLSTGLSMRVGSALTGLLVLLATSEVRAQEGLRPPGTRTRTNAESRRYHTGPDELQPEVLRPRGFSSLSPGEAAEALKEISAAHPERSLESLLPGFEKYRAVRERLRRLAEQRGEAIRVTTVGEVAGLSIDRVDLIGQPESGRGPRPRVLIVGGIHSGTEVVGLESATRFLESAVKDKTLRSRFDITVVPLLNPTGLVLGTRRNLDGVDVNRTFMDGKWTAESIVLRDIARAEKFDLVLDLHAAGDRGRDGFFMIRAVEDAGLSERIMRAMESSALLDAPGAKPGEAKVGPYELYSLGLAMTETSGTSMKFLGSQGARYVYTVEAPTRADAELQVRGTLKLIHSSLNNTRRYGTFGVTSNPLLMEQIRNRRGRSMESSKGSLSLVEAIGGKVGQRLREARTRRRSRARR